jgi:hypothetical protein
MRTLTGYGIAVVIVLAILNGIFWLVGNPRLQGLNVFSAGFILGMFGMYLAVWIPAARRLTDALRPSWREAFRPARPAKLLTKDKARQIGANVATLPDGAPCLYVQ